jgi:hypothetical protein
MSVKELIFKTAKNTSIIFKYENNSLKMFDELLSIEVPYEFNRSEAYLLMLYLQEHLK